MAKRKFKKIPRKKESTCPQVFIAGGCLLGVLSLLIGNSAFSVKRASAQVTSNDFKGTTHDPVLLSENLIVKNTDEKTTFSTETKAKHCSYATHFGMRCKKTCGLTFEADYLYWQPQEDGLGYATEISGWLPGEDISFINRAHLVEHSSNWGSGFRVGIGENLPYDLWDINFDWTYFNHRNTNHLHSDTSSIIAVAIISLFGPFDTFTVSDASSAWHLRFSMMDLDIGRKFLFGNHFILRPNAGLKGGWINQTQSINYSKLTEIVFGILPDTRVKKINDFAGLGPELGIDMRWLLGHQFGIFGTVNTALLYGHFDIETKFYFYDSLITNTPAIIDSKNRLRPALQLLLGLDWEKCFGKTKLGLGAGYELQYWWNQQQNQVNFYPPAVSSGGDLTMHGLTAKVKLEF